MRKVTGTNCVSIAYKLGTKKILQNIFLLAQQHSVYEGGREGVKKLRFLENTQIHDVPVLILRNHANFIVLSRIKIKNICKINFPKINYFSVLNLVFGLF